MKRRLTIVMLGAIPAVLAWASYITTYWGGSCLYPQLEYEFKFQDSNGNPIAGVELTVENQSGEKFFCFPVTDYLPSHAPKSGKDGVVRFHHVSTAVEWDNYGWSLFWLFPIRTTRSPSYTCRFLRGGKEVCRALYGDLPDWDWPGEGWEGVPKVTRRWNWSEMIPGEIVDRPGDTFGSYYSQLRHFFHYGDDETPTREVVVASRNAERLVFKLEASSPTKPAVEDIEFPVIRRTITVLGPPGQMRSAF